MRTWRTPPPSLMHLAWSGARRAPPPAPAAWGALSSMRTPRLSQVALDTALLEPRLRVKRVAQTMAVESQVALDTALVKRVAQTMAAQEAARMLAAIIG